MKCRYLHGLAVADTCALPARLREYRGRISADFKRDRLKANERG